MNRIFKKLTAMILVICTLACCSIVAFAAEETVYGDLVSKTAAINDDGSYKVSLKVPGQDGDNKHDEVILMVDGSYSGDDEWNSMVDAIVTIGQTVLNGNGNTQLTLMAFGMGDNEVLVHVKDVETLAAALGELPGSLLYGRSSTNCEAGFTGVAEYIAAHDETLNDAHVIYITDGEVNTDEHVSNFYDWKHNGWHRFSEELIITANFEAECGAIMEGANRSHAFVTVFGEGDVETIFANATYEMMDAYNAQIWADVYAEAGLDPNGEHPVSDVERAFVDYDNKHNTYVQDNFYYALIGRTYPNRTQRTIDAGNALAAMEQVKSLYIVDNNRTTAWMQTVGGENFIPAGSVANLIPALAGALTNLATTPFNDVVVTDYMSKWVILDPASVAVVDDTTGEAIWTAVDGWLIEDGRPTAAEPVIIEKVSAAKYALGGADVVGNAHGDIYKLTWSVKDGAMLRSENYHLEYNVTLDTQEPGYVAGLNYPANGDTTVDYKDENGEDKTEDIKVPEVHDDVAPESLGRGSDTATGYYCLDCGDRNCDHYGKITKKGTWFMYNAVVLKDGESATFAIQAGNNKNSDNIVGSYTITRQGNQYYVTYSFMDEHVIAQDAHLGLSSKMSFKAKPGKDDNADYGVWETVNGVKNDTIYIFAHFSINY